jgi:hypothetical protein
MTEIVQNSTEKIPFIISSTCLNRPTLHQDVFPNWMVWVGTLDLNKYAVHWFVNIDMIEKLPYTRDETIESLRQLCPFDFTLHVYSCDENGGNFLKACQRLSTNIDTFICDWKINNQSTDDIKILWLEDDWKVHLSVSIDINTIIDLYSTQFSNVNLTFIRSNYLHALAPSIISYPLWKHIHLDAWTKQGDISIDPEHCAGVHYLKTCGKYTRIKNITVINKKIASKYMDQPFLRESNSFFTFHDSKFEIDIPEDMSSKYIPKEDIKSVIGNTCHTFIRISPTICGDGCDYGRNFLEKNGVYKIGKTKLCSDFYTYDKV